MSDEGKSKSEKKAKSLSTSLTLGTLIPWAFGLPVLMFVVNLPNPGGSEKSSENDVLIFMAYTGACALIGLICALLTYVYRTYKDKKEK